ncbi:pectinesterase [Sarracenia purpurea var. burkii]
MGMNLGLFFVFISFSAFFSHALPNDPRGDIDYWCSNTPHPEPCKFFMGGRRRFVPKGRAGFRRMAVEVAMDQALHAQVHTNELRRLCRSKHEMTAWMDCSKLISNTVLQLNKTLQGLQNKAINCSDFDVQTWLSAAMTYLEICRAGSVDLNVSDFISPIVSTNVSELISNGLSITGVLLDEEEAKGEFPSWVSDGERKLLESPSLASQASIVVAKDGSGNFGSIQAAINYGVSKRNGNGRIIIRVKVGVYSENIEISNNMNNVTLVGDGLRNTIITGSRSVKAGFTTYSSATVGK